MTNAIWSARVQFAIEKQKVSMKPRAFPVTHVFHVYDLLTIWKKFRTKTSFSTFPHFTSLCNRFVSRFTYILFNSPFPVPHFNEWRQYNNSTTHNAGWSPIFWFPTSQSFSSSFYMTLYGDDTIKIQAITVSYAASRWLLVKNIIFWSFWFLMQIYCF